MKFGKRAVAAAAAVFLAAAAVLPPLAAIAATYNVTQSRYPADISQFPASYQAGLTAVKEKYPNARFICFDTGLDWSADVLGPENEMQFGRNLIEQRNISSWKGTDMPGAFNWDANEYVQVEPGWNQASRAIIEFYLDPRNFFTEEQIFQFEQYTYSADVQTLEGTESTLSGTFMSADHGAVIRDDEEHDLTYAQAFMKIAEIVGISPYVLATRIRFEQGVAGSGGQISGTWPGYEGYYNYFNMGATGSTKEEIYTNALIEAKNEGWDSRWKALLGGAQKFADRYVKMGRNTPYLQHFAVNVQPGGTTVYYYPYMTAVQSPESEARRFYQTYQGMENFHEQPFVFVIPVYKNMPASPVPRPTGDGNPNNKLKNLTINDGHVNIGAFNKDTLDSYTTIVPGAMDKVTVQATLLAATSTVTVNGVAATQDGVNTSAEVPLAVGSNTVKVEVKAENGSVRTYSIGITRMQPETPETTTAPGEEGTTLSAEEQATLARLAAYQFSTMTLSGNVAHGIQPGTSVSTLLAGFTGKNCSPKILKADGTIPSSTDNAGTGMVVVITHTDGQEVARFDLIVYGDCSGDGVINVRDMLYLQRHIVGLETLNDSLFAAIDLDGNGELNVRDMLYLQRHIVGLETIAN